MTEKEYRLVAHILPETDGWGLGQVDESDFPRIATKEQIGHARFGYVFCKVGPPSTNLDGRMIYDYNVRIVDAPQTMEKWSEIIEHYTMAITKGPLFREDFTDVFED